MNAEASCLLNWKEMMKSLDTDSSGTINKEELLFGYANKEIGQQLRELHLGRRDLSAIFELMDCEGSGEAPYIKLIDCFLQAQQQDARVYMMFLQLRLQSIESRLTAFMERWSPDPIGAVGSPVRGPCRGENPSTRACAGAQPAPRGAEGSSKARAPTVAPEPHRACKHGGEDLTAASPTCDLSGQLLESLRDAIDRRLDAIVAEVVEPVERLPRSRSADVAAERDGSPRFRARVSRTRPTTRPLPDLDAAEPASGERPLPSPPPGPVSRRRNNQSAAHKDSCACCGSTSVAQRRKTTEATDESARQTLRN